MCFYVYAHTYISFSESFFALPVLTGSSAGSQLHIQATKIHSSVLLHQGHANVIYNGDGNAILQVVTSDTVDAQHWS